MQDIQERAAGFLDEIKVAEAVTMNPIKQTTQSYKRAGAAVSHMAQRAKTNRVAFKKKMIGESKKRPSWRHRGRRILGHLNRPPKARTRGDFGGRKLTVPEKKIYGRDMEKAQNTLRGRPVQGTLAVANLAAGGHLARRLHQLGKRGYRIPGKAGLALKGLAAANLAFGVQGTRAAIRGPQAAKRDIKRWQRAAGYKTDKYGYRAEDVVVTREELIDAVMENQLGEGVGKLVGAAVVGGLLTRAAMKAAAKKKALAQATRMSRASARKLTTKYSGKSNLAGKFKRGGS